MTYATVENIISERTLPDASVLTHYRVVGHITLAKLEFPDGRVTWWADESEYTSRRIGAGAERSEVDAMGTVVRIMHRQLENAKTSAAEARAVRISMSSFLADLAEQLYAYHPDKQSHEVDAEYGVTYR